MEKKIIMETQKVYYPHLDVLKGIAILLMVMGHVIPWTLNQPFLHKPMMELNGNELYLSLLYKIIYSFHMPLLFFVSGYLFFKPTAYDCEQVKSIINKRISRILIPYLATGSLLLISRGHWGYWFLQCLFCMNVMVAFMLYLIGRFKFDLRKELALYALVGVGLFLFSKVCKSLETDTFGVVVIGRLFTYYPTFMLGLLMSKYIRLREFLKNQYVVFGCFVLYIVAFILSERQIPVLSFISSVLLPITMILYLNQLVLRNANMMGGVIAYVGKNSMEVYILHSFFVIVFKEVGSYMLTLDSLVTCVSFQLVYSFFLSIVAITLSILVAEFLKGSAILKRLLFGL